MLSRIQAKSYLISVHVPRELFHLQLHIPPQTAPAVVDCTPGPKDSAQLLQVSVQWKKLRVTVNGRARARVLPETIRPLLSAFGLVVVLARTRQNRGRGPERQSGLQPRKMLEIGAAKIYHGCRTILTTRRVAGCTSRVFGLSVRPDV